MCSIVRVTEPVDIQRAGDGITVTLRSGTDTYAFHIGRHDARVASAEVWRLLDDIERASDNVKPLRRRR